MAVVCLASEHNFVLGGEGVEDWDKYFICSKCGTIAMVPSDAESGATLFPPEQKKTAD